MAAVSHSGEGHVSLLFVNTARGPVVEQSALVDALDTGHLLGAGIDVFEREPLDDDRLRHHPRVILTPHSAFYSIEGFADIQEGDIIEAYTREVIT